MHHEQRARRRIEMYRVLRVVRRKENRDPRVVSDPLRRPLDDHHLISALEMHGDVRPLHQMRPDLRARVEAKRLLDPDPPHRPRVSTAISARRDHPVVARIDEPLPRPPPRDRPAPPVPRRPRRPRSPWLLR